MSTLLEVGSVQKAMLLGLLDTYPTMVERAEGQFVDDEGHLQTVWKQLWGRSCPVLL